MSGQIKWIRVGVILTGIALLVLLVIARKYIIYKWHIYKIESTTDYCEAMKPIGDLRAYIQADPSIADMAFQSLIDDQTLAGRKALLADLLFVGPRRDLVTQALDFYEQRVNPDDGHAVMVLGAGSFENGMPELGWRGFDLQKKYVKLSSGMTVGYATGHLSFVPKNEIERAVQELRNLEPQIKAKPKLFVGLAIQEYINDGKTTISVGVVDVHLTSPTVHYYETLHNAVMTSGMKLTPLP